ncbi:uncharacterized protein LOC117104688 [Anneissia japonica]|uniref:uncharacterized protein LOC117104688 n=1 Tax=Anneissia japonica TaxID=1529436 RepID=UPI001425AFEB|nr:uncharacterized protein LOC117104688 [Anneissia japonica]
MDLLNSPVSEVWKATKRVFTLTDAVDDRKSKPTAADSERGADGRSGIRSRSVTGNNKTKGPKAKSSAHSTSSLNRQGKTRTLTGKDLQSVTTSGTFASGNYNINDSDNLADDYDFDNDFFTSQRSSVSANRYHTLDPKMNSLMRSRYSNDVDTERFRQMEASQRSLPASDTSARSRAPRTSNSRVRTRSKSSDRVYGRIDQEPMYLRRRSLSIDEELQEEQGEKMKSKLLTMWNNVKYGWTVKVKTTFNYQKPVWFLGSCYHQRPEGINNTILIVPGIYAHLLEVYKSNFIYTPQRSEAPVEAVVFVHVLFHAVVVIVLVLVVVVLVGKLFFPTISKVQEAVDAAPDLHPLLEQICIYVGQDCTIYKQDVIDICTSRQTSSLQPVYKVPTTYNDSTKVDDSNGHYTNPASTNSSHHLDKRKYTNYNDNSVYKKNNEMYKVQNLSANLSDIGNQRRKVSAGQIDHHHSDPRRGAASSQGQNGAQSSSNAEINNPGTSNGRAKRHSSGDLECDSAPGTSKATEDSPWTAVVILIPVRLGGEVVNPIYLRGIQSLFTMENCLGIIGGKPKHSLYFVGFQEEKLIHLDPHFCQGMVDMRNHQFPLHSFHCMSPRKMSISKMDPSCTIGFYCRTRRDFEEFCRVIPEVVTPPKHEGDYPMFIVRDGRCEEWNAKAREVTNKPERYLRVRHVDENGRIISPVRESEDFVFLET